MENREELNPARTPPESTPPVPSPESDEAADDSSMTLRQWLIANSVALILVAAVVAAIIYWLGLANIPSIAKAALGLSFVVFVHELGHFLVAKWCDVHVTTFSIGFGPAIPGCAFQWRETTYKLALIPIGGYVQMVGQVDGDEASDGSEDYPRSYRNKSVGQRMAIISAGVIMNVILAVICFVVVFEGPGKDRQAAVVGRVDTGAPAYTYGIRTGARILEIGSTKDPYFEDLMVTVMGSMHGERIRFVSDLPGQPPTTLDIEPRLSKNDAKPMIGIAPPEQLELRSRRATNPEMSAPVAPESAAARAQPAFAFGDRIVATTDPDDPKRGVKELPDDPRLPGKGRHDYFEFARRMRLLAGETVTIRVERPKDDGARYPVDVRVPPMYGLTLGVRMQMGPISAIRIESPADRAGLLGRKSDGTREGDLIQAVEVTEPDGKVLRFADKDLDPERLPHQLKQWARRVADAEKGNPGAAKTRVVKLTVRRHRNESGPQFETLAKDVTWDDRWRFDEDVPMSASSPMAIPELGLAYQIKAVVAAIVPGAVADNPLQVGDVVKNYRFTYIDAAGKEKTGSWLEEDLEEGQWARASEALLRSTMKITKLELKVGRGKDVQQVAVIPAADESWPLDDRGWLLMADTRRQKADNFLDAVVFGLRDTYGGIIQVFQNLRGMITGRVSVRNLGGPVLIANVAYRIAGYDFWEFVFFLGLISVNLAVVNFLPIPVLDGGHMVFLIYEKLLGRPASEPIRVAATYAGLALILSLFVFVTWLDFWRFF